VNYFALVPLLVSLANFFVFTYILAGARSSNYKVWFLLIVASIGLMNFSESLIWLVDGDWINDATLELIFKISTILWLPLIFYLFQFLARFMGKPTPRLVYLFASSLIVVYIIILFSDMMISGVYRNIYGVLGVAAEWMPAALIYALFFPTLWLGYFGWRYKSEKKSVDNNKKPVFYIVIIASAGLLFAALDFVFPPGYFTNFRSSILGLLVIALFFVAKRQHILFRSHLDVVESSFAAFNGCLIEVDMKGRIVGLVQKDCGVIALLGNDIVGLDISTLMPDGYDFDCDCFEKDYKVVGGRSFVYTQSTIKKDGKVYGKMILFVDVTTRREVEAALQKSENLFHAIFNKAPIGIILSDMDGGVVDLNEKMLKILGSPSKELSKKINLLSFEPLVKSGISNDFAECIKSNDYKSASHLYSSLWGKEVYINGNLGPLKDRDGKMSGVLGVFEDVTSKREMESKLARSHRKYRTIFNTVKTGLMIVDETGEITLSNEGFRSLITAESRKKEHLFLQDIVKKSDVAMVMKYLEQRIKGEGSPPSEYELSLIAKDGVSKTGLVAVAPLPGERTVIVSVVDLTQKLKLEQELKQMLIERDRFFSIMGHDLRNSIHSLRLFMDLVTSEYINLFDEQIQELAHHASRGVDSSLELFENLINWAGNDFEGLRHNPKTVDLFTVVESQLSLVKEAVERKKISLENKVSESLDVFADEEMLATVIRNLISNAVKFTGENQSIVVSAEVEGSNVVVEIVDSGVGIPSDIIDDIFELGTETARRGTDKEKGSGLGLVLVKDFVEKNGGNIWVESKEGEGSKFFFTVPIGKD